MDYTFERLLSIQHDIGGSVIYLECEDKPELLSFYQNEKNRFRIFGERNPESENVRYIQLLKLI